MAWMREAHWHKQNNFVPGMLVDVFQAMMLAGQGHQGFDPLEKKSPFWTYLLQSSVVHKYSL
jgi:hypothetical protein